FLLQFLLLVVYVAIPHIGIVTLNIHIALVLDASLFSANRVRNPLRILDLPLAEGNLFSHYRLLINRHLLLANRNPVGLAFTYWRIGWLARSRMALDDHLFTVNRHIERLLFRNHIFAQANCACLY